MLIVEATTHRAYQAVIRTVADSDHDVNKLRDTSKVDDRTDTLSSILANIVLRIFTRAIQGPLHTKFT